MEKLSQAKEMLGEVIFGKEEVIDLLFIALIAEGHVLLESVPGTGKTKLVKSFAKVVAGQFDRIQFTPDVLPSDVTGIRFFNPETKDFELRLGPVMTNILLADEINRATPKTQSSLLEVMEEYQATVDGEKVPLPLPFIVIATKNPIERHHGTFPLPEAQLDRFLFKITLNYPEMEDERQILQTYQSHDPFETIESILSLKEIIALQEAVQHVIVGDVVMDYLLQLVHASRKHLDVEVGISPRGMLALMKAAQAKALIQKRSYVSPEDLQQLVPYVFTHRLILTLEGAMKKTPAQVVQETLKQVQVPVEYGVDE